MNSRYRAFLSYSHADEAAATRLHRTLERYVLPRRVRKAHALPRRLIPIFRDVEELAAASGLTTRLQDALDQSQWLIVLCSPAAAQSKYVNQEIEYFLQKHGASRILCALAEGEPPDCFPPAIKALKEEPLAADFRPGKDFELSKLKLLAALAGVGFTELRSREAQRRKRLQLIAAALLAGIGLGGVAWWDFYQREHVGYFSHYVRRYGIWQGVDPLSTQLAARRNESYRFTRRGRLNPPLRVDFVDGSGVCPSDGMNYVYGEGRAVDKKGKLLRLCTVEFEYSQDGRIALEMHYADRGPDYGITLGQITYAGSELAQILTFNRNKTASVTTGINFVMFKRDKNGFDAHVYFLRELGTWQANHRGEFGLIYAYDDAGRVVRRGTIDARREESSEITRTVYSPDGLPLEIRHEDAAGQPRTAREGYSTARMEYDADGNRTGVSYFDISGKPIIPSTAPGSLAHFYGQ